MRLSANSRIGIVGGGPSGAMSGFFLLELAERLGLPLSVDIYEPRDFTQYGPVGCNMCAGVVSESLIQTLAAEGFPLPSSLVVQNGISSYVLHTSGLPTVTIPAPVDEVRIAAVYRGGGPRKPVGAQGWESFDHFLLEQARQKGARVIPMRITDLSWEAGLPTVIGRGGYQQSYDFLVGAVGVNSPTLKKFADLGFAFEPPPVSKGFLAEIYLGAENIQHYMGSSLHIFLLDIPRLKFAALIPKVEYVTVCLLGEAIDKELVQRFMAMPEVRSCLPADWQWAAPSKECDMGQGQTCQCGPKLNLGPATHPFADRVALVGDAAVTRLYKDGIGAAYVTAKACAVTALFFGIAATDFQKHYQPVIQRIATDNRIGRLIFWITLFYQEWNFLRRGMVRMVREEQSLAGGERRMSRVLWDTFTGSASYREIFLRALQPSFFFHLLSATFRAWLVHLFRR
ncbi:MAG: hypothetical protein HQL88_06815 [Magnetococcales bacterium]|nr:hypothetical protein [Magnetococcales bacterium]